MEPRGVSVATTTKDLGDLNALKIKSGTNKKQHQFYPTKKVHSESLPVRRSSASIAATKYQTWAIGATIVVTARNEELDFIGYNKILQ